MNVYEYYCISMYIMIILIVLFYTGKCFKALLLVNTGLCLLSGAKLERYGNSDNLLLVKQPIHSSIILLHSYLLGLCACSSLVLDMKCAIEYTGVLVCRHRY